MTVRKTPLTPWARIPVPTYFWRRKGQCSAFVEENLDPETMARIPWLWSLYRAGRNTTSKRTLLASGGSRTCAGALRVATKALMKAAP